ncbi:MAG: flagellar basal body protein [Phycisphaerales bacterium]|jgi:flagellar basal-body rod protein FlgB|nr:flagellar basal body protein [Phycisphaerales bacterium]
MSIQGLTDGGAIPALEAMARFSAARQRLIADNVANLDTPGYQPLDADPKAFQEQIGRAIDARRSDPVAAGSGPLTLQNRGPMRQLRGGEVVLDAAALNENLMFHDKNDRNLERIMQDVAENLLAFRAATELMRNRFRTIDLAIRERF